MDWNEEMSQMKTQNMRILDIKTLSLHCTSFLTLRNQRMKSVRFV